MHTIYDWLTVAIFCGLVVLFLQRSAGEPRQGDGMVKYLGAGVGCAVANYLGNEGYEVVAVVAITGVLAFIFFALNPFRPAP